MTPGDRLLLAPELIVIELVDAALVTLERALRRTSPGRCSAAHRAPARAHARRPGSRTETAGGNESRQPPSPQKTSQPRNGPRPRSDEPHAQSFFLARSRARARPPRSGRVMSTDRRPIQTYVPPELARRLQEHCKTFALPRARSCASPWIITSKGPPTCASFFVGWIGSAERSSGCNESTS
jgi:hypothetical protein